MLERLCVLLLASLLCLGASAEQRLNIVWIIADDLSQDLGCYGEPAVSTPHCDRLAGEGTRFTNAFATAPACSPSRSALITGCYQTSIGAQHHRTLTKPDLPEGVEPITEAFRRAGYRVYNTNANMKGRGKTDYNFRSGVKKMYDGHNWSEAKGRPFFAQVQIYQPHRPFFGANQDEQRRERLRLPGGFPEHPLARADYADYLAAVEKMDGAVGEVVKRLEAEGLLEQTVIFFFGDHGRPMPRCKQWLYDGGLRVPLLVRDPTGRLPQGSLDERFVSLIDVAATSLSYADATPAKRIEGIDFGVPGFSGREAVFAARDRMGATPDRVRSVQVGRYKLIRNYRPELPYVHGLSENAYILEHHPIHTLWRALGEQGKLSVNQASYLRRERPEFELYDLQTDPNEMNNLAVDPDQAERLERLKSRLNDWVASTGDRGGGVDPDASRTAAGNAANLKKLRRNRGADDQAMLDYWMRRYGLRSNQEPAGGPSR